MRAPAPPPRRDRPRRAARRRLLPLLALAAACAACARPEPRPHVVLVVIDQLRFDFSSHLLTRVNALAEEGVAFRRMRAAAPWTYPSVVSLLSGLQPQQHGAEGHPRDARYARFDPGIPLLQRRLQGLGYATAAFVTNPYLLPWNAFHEGFAHFDGHFVAARAFPNGAIENVWNPAAMYADSVNRAVTAHFDTRPPAAPEFSYVHYIDVHGPWEDAPFPPTYRDAIDFVDRHAVALYHYFMRRYRGDVLFFVTSDHGRAFEDDETVGYGPSFRSEKHSVHDFNLRVPFLILPSERVRGPRVVDGVASHVDFVPTLLDWLGETPDASQPGRSLLPAIRGEAPLPAYRPTYARHWAFGLFSDAVVIGDRKFVRYFGDPEAEELLERRVFDLAEDPRETRAIDESFAPVEPIFRTLEQAPRFEPVFAPVPKEVEEPLRALGYLEESGQEADQRPDS